MIPSESQEGLKKQSKIQFPPPLPLRFGPYYTEPTKSQCKHRSGSLKPDIASHVTVGRQLRNEELLSRKYLSFNRSAPLEGDDAFYLGPYYRNVC